MVAKAVPGKRDKRIVRGRKKFVSESLSNEGVFLTKHFVALQDKNTACERNGHP